MIYMDIPPDAPPPKRGDIVLSPRTSYYILHARKVSRRDPSARPRYHLHVAKPDELDWDTQLALLRSADRRGGSFRWEFRWYPRKKKTRSFEVYLGRQ